MKKTKKRKIPMRTRRRIFLSVCCLVVVLVVMLIANACDSDKKAAEDIASAVKVNAVDCSPETETIVVGRYDDISFETWEIDEMASIIYLEARNQSAKGQQAVAEVILNRVLNDAFPNTINEVLHEGESKGVVQFTTIKALDTAKPTKEQYQAINEALYGEPVLPLDVVFFSRNGENDNVWGKIDDHVFCYAYKWE